MSLYRDDNDSLTEDEYLNLLDIRERFRGRRQAVAVGEVIYPPDEYGYFLHHLDLTNSKFREYNDGKVFEIVPRYSSCPATSDEDKRAHMFSTERKDFCSRCGKALSE